MHEICKHGGPSGNPLLAHRFQNYQGKVYSGAGKHAGDSLLVRLVILMVKMAGEV